MKSEEGKIEKKEVVSLLKGYEDSVAVSKVVSQRPQLTHVASLSASEVEECGVCGERAVC